MFEPIIAIAAVVAAGGLLFAFLRHRGSGLAEEDLGNPHPHHAEPVVRAESRHTDTPSGADLDRPGGRHDG